MDENEFQSIVNDFEMPIHRVKKKRVLSEKQKDNWARALETRRKNIQLRKKAKEEISKIEKEQLMNDPSLKNREKRLKELLLLMLSADEKVQQPVVRKPESSRPLEAIEKVVIKRLNENKQESEKSDEEEAFEEDEEVKYTPKTLFTNAGRGNSQKTLRKPLKNDSDDDDDREVSIFRD